MAAPPESGGRGKRPFQFHLITLFVCMTVSAVVFALIGRLGVNGLTERLGAALVVAGVLAPHVELYYWWKQNEEDGW